MNRRPFAKPAHRRGGLLGRSLLFLLLAAAVAVSVAVGVHPGAASGRTAGEPAVIHAQQAGFNYISREPVHDDDYPHPTGSADQYGFAANECTSFAAFRVASRDHVDIGQLVRQLGGTGLDAKNWNRFATVGVPLDNTPAAGAVAWSSAGTYGHVAWVRQVLPNGTMIIEDYNELWDDAYHSWVVPVANSGFTGFLHFERYGQSSAPSGTSSSNSSTSNSSDSGGLTVTTNPGGSQGGTVAVQGGSGSGLQGSSGSTLQGGSGSGLQGSGSPGQGGGSSPAVTLAQGPAASGGGYWFAISLSGYGAGTRVAVTCADSVSPVGFRTVTFTTAGSGAAASSSACYSGDGPGHWVTTSNGLRSNTVDWGASSSQPAPQQQPVSSDPGPSSPATADGPVFPVMNTSETLPDGVWFRNSPHTADTSRITGLGVYTGEQVQLGCYSFGDAVGPYADTLWYRVSNVSRPTNGGSPNTGFLNAHYINDGQSANAVDAGVPAC